MQADPSAVSVRHRIDYVDGLRALAVIGVIVHHTAAQGVNGVLYRVLREGAHGVDLFFVISGFCLAFPVLAKARSGASVAFDIREFATKRLVRIIPPFYIATAVLLALAVVPHLVTRHALPDGLPSPRSLGASLVFLDDNVQLLNGSFWTLMVEFRWYFLFPLALWLWFASPRAFFTAGIASLVLYHFTRARGLDFGTLPGFMLGIVAADVQLDGERTAPWGPWLRRWAWAVLAVGIVAGMAAEPSATIPGFNRADILFAYQPTIVGWQVACFAFVVLAGARPMLRRFLSIRPLVLLGIASYGIYLIHEPIILLIESRLHGGGGSVVAAIAALAAGCLFWALAEIPFTTGSLRAPLIAAIRPVVARALAVCGVPATVTLPPRPATDPLPGWSRPRVAVAGIAAVTAFSILLGSHVYGNLMPPAGSTNVALRFSHVLITTLPRARTPQVVLDPDGRGGVIGAPAGGAGFALYRPGRPPVLIDASTRAYAGDAQVADVNGDGAPDIVVGDVRGVTVLYNPHGRRCADVYRCMWAKRPIDPSRPSRDVVVGDVDGDGAMDVATESGVYFARDGGHRWVFAGRRLINRDGAGTTLADLAGDGILDVIAPYRSGTMLARFVNPRHAGGDPARDVWHVQIIDADPPFHGSMTTTTADLNGDGHRDIVLAPMHGAGGLVWYEAPARASDHWTRHMIDPTINNVRQGSLHVADFRGDGHRDIAFAEQAPHGRMGVLCHVDGHVEQWRLQVLAVGASRSIDVGVLGHDRVPSIIAAAPDASAGANALVAWKPVTIPADGTSSGVY